MLTDREAAQAAAALGKWFQSQDIDMIGSAAVCLRLTAYCLVKLARDEDHLAQHINVAKEQLENMAREGWNNRDSWEKPIK